MRSWCTALLYALAIAGYPLVSALPATLHVDSRLVSIPYRGAFLLLALLVMAFNARRRNVYVGIFWLPLGVFWLLYSARMSVDTVFQPVPLYYRPYEYFLYAFGFCLIPMLAFLTAPDERTLRRGAVATLVVSSVACIAALYATYSQLMSGNVSSFVQNGRFASETLNPILLGHLGVTVTIMAGMFLFSVRAWTLRLLLAALAVLGLFAAAIAASRGPILAFALVLLFQFGVWVRGQSARKVTGVLLAAAVGIALLVQGAFMIEEQLGFQTVSRFEVLQDVRGNESTRDHLDAATDAWDQFLAHPATGSGLEEKRSGFYPHNVAIESFMATGVFGGVAFCVFILGTLLSSLRLASYGPARWIVLLYLQQLIGALLAGALYLSGGMWCFGAALIAIAAYRRRVAAATPAPELAPLGMPVRTGA